MALLRLLEGFAKVTIGVLSLLVELLGLLEALLGMKEELLTLHLELLRVNEILRSVRGGWGNGEVSVCVRNWGGWGGICYLQ